MLVSSSSELAEMDSETNLMFRQSSIFSSFILSTADEASGGNSLPGPVR